MGDAASSTAEMPPAVETTASAPEAASSTTVGQQFSWSLIAPRTPLLSEVAPLPLGVAFQPQGCPSNQWVVLGDGQAGVQRTRFQIWCHY